MPPKKRKGSLQDYLRNEILLGNLQEGTFLRQKTIAERFGVSRTPAREALKALESEGLLENLPNRGYRVRKQTLRDLLEIIDIRALLEGYAARLTAMSRTPNLSQTLHSLAEKIEKEENRHRRTGKAKDMIAWSKAEYEFHNTIVRASGNNLLIRLMNSLNFQFISFMREKTHDSEHGAIPTHHDIADAIAQSDPERDERMAKQHLVGYKKAGLESYLGPASHLDL